jgi:hypothetical protein
MAGTMGDGPASGVASHAGSGTAQATAGERPGRTPATRSRRRADGKVIGCVWAAWRRLQDDGDQDLEYDWCEGAWLEYGLGRLLGPAPIDGDKLVAHLRVFRANGWVPTDRRPARPLVCSVCGRSVATEGVGADGRYYCPPCYAAPVQQVLAL